MNDLSAKNLADTLINRLKNLKLYEVETSVPDYFRLNGPVPFNLKISDGKITAQIYALDVREAVDKLNEYIGSCTL